MDGMNDELKIGYFERKAFLELARASGLAEEVRIQQTPTDGWDSTPRPTGREHDPNQLPLGHIAFRGDFEPPKHD